MTWQPMPTFVDGVAVTAAQLNLLVGNLLETAPAKASTGVYPHIFASTGANGIAERVLKDAQVDDFETTTATSYTDLGTVGPLIGDITQGGFVMIFMNASLDNSGTFESRVTMEVDGDGGNGGRDIVSVGTNRQRQGVSQLKGATPGLTTVKALYRVSGGTGTFGTRRMTVIAL